MTKSVRPAILSLSAAGATRCASRSVEEAAGRERDLEAAGRLFTKATILSMPGWLRKPLARLDYIDSAVGAGRVVPEAEPSTDSGDR